MPKRFLYLFLLAFGITGLFATAQNASGDEGYRRSAEAYQKGLRAFGSKKFEQALEQFNQVLAMNLSHRDAALYWQASAYFKMNQLAFAKQHLKRFFEEFPDSNWQEDARALEAEIMAASGSEAENIDFESLSPSTVMVALMNFPPEDAIPIIQSLLAKNTDRRYKEQALFALTQFQSEQARTILEDYAKDETSGLSLAALRYLALSPGKDTMAFLSNQYQISQNTDRKMEILTAFMLARDTARLGEIAANEPNSRLATQAINLLGAMGEQESLRQLYSETQDRKRKKAILQSTAFSKNPGFLTQLIETEPDDELRKAALQQLGIGGHCDALGRLYSQFEDLELKSSCLEALFIGQRCGYLQDIAETEPEDELRHKALTYLGIIGGDYLETLSHLYRTSPFEGDKRTIIQAFFIQRNSEPLLEIYDTETDPELKQFALQMLSMLPQRDD